MGLPRLAFNPEFSETHQLFVIDTQKSFLDRFRSIIAEFKIGSELENVDLGTNMTFYPATFNISQGMKSGRWS